MQHYQAVSKILLGAKDAINAILSSPEDELHRLKIAQHLQQQSDALLLLTGAGDVAENKSSILGPATSIGGTPIQRLPRITEGDLKPSDDKVFNLKKQVENALLYFGSKSNSEGILANIPELIIRGVAKKAGLKVTKDEPKQITVEFIDAIKLALHPIELRPKELTKEEAERLMENYTSEVQLVHSSLSAEDMEISETHTPAETTEAVEDNAPAAEELAEPKAEPKEAKKPKGNK